MAFPASPESREWLHSGPEHEKSCDHTSGRSESSPFPDASRHSPLHQPTDQNPSPLPCPLMTACVLQMSIINCPVPIHVTIRNCEIENCLQMKRLYTHKMEKTL